MSPLTWLFPSIILFATLHGADLMSTPPAPDHIQTRLSVADGSLDMTFEVVNEGAEPHRFCVYMTPFEGFKGDILDVIDADDGYAEYLGPSVKRGAPKDRHFETVAPGETRSVTFDLAAAYDVSAPGIYTVQFEGSEDMNGLPDSNVAEVTVE